MIQSTSHGELIIICTDMKLKIFYLSVRYFSKYLAFLIQ